MKREDINESVLAKANLTSDEMKFARVFYELKTAGGRNSSTQKFVRALGDKKREDFRESVVNKVHKVLQNRAGN